MDHGAATGGIHHIAVKYNPKFTLICLKIQCSDIPEAVMHPILLMKEQEQNDSSSSNRAATCLVVLHHEEMH